MARSRPNPDLKSQLRTLARRSADALRDRDLFGSKPPSIPRLLDKLELGVRSVHGLQVRGLLSRKKEVVVREELSDAQRRFVILHEIGHAVLFRDYPKYAETLESWMHEEFAFHFACSLLVTEEEVSHSIKLFKELESPKDLVKAARSSGVPLALFLQMPRVARDSLAGSNKFWLRCRFTVNRFTRKDVKLRIVVAQYDLNRWYLPTNKSFESVFGDSRWLSDISVGEERQREGVEMNVHYMVNRPRQKYSLAKASGMLRAMALNPTAADDQIGFLVLAIPREDHPAFPGQLASTAAVERSG
jgi:hypothetical protein